MKVAHNMAISSSFNNEQERWMHHLSIVVSDLDKENQTIEKSEQINMAIMPTVEPATLVEAMRSFCDAIEQYSTTGEKVGFEKEQAGA